MAALRHMVFLQRDVPKAARFYSEALGLSLLVCTEHWAELRCAAGTRIALKATDRWVRNLLDVPLMVPRFRSWSPLCSFWEDVCASKWSVWRPHLNELGDGHNGAMAQWQVN